MNLIRSQKKRMGTIFDSLFMQILTLCFTDYLLGKSREGQPLGLQIGPEGKDFYEYITPFVYNTN